ncbi:MAG: fumarylacetoacetate hydrolase family protein [Candidatus Dormibacteria bacterium]
MMRPGRWSKRVGQIRTECRNRRTMNRLRCEPFSSTAPKMAELTAVIGRRCSGVPPSQALDYVYGFTVSNDLSARDARFEHTRWVRGKTFDGFFPIGPCILPADQLGDPQAASLKTWVNGDLVQDGNTSDMIFSVAELVPYLSRTITLEPGDVIATGTPWGVGFVSRAPRFLQHGDRVTLAAGEIGRLTNVVEFAA